MSVETTGRLQLAQARREVEAEAIAPQTLAAGVIAKSGGSADTSALTTVLQDLTTAINGGDLSHVEGMLITQAVTLQSLFAHLAEKALACADFGKQDARLRLALKAQAQCRATLETLAEVKNPRPVFVKAQQANIAGGHQQVNNGAPPQRAGDRN